MTTIEFDEASIARAGAHAAAPAVLRAAQRFGGGVTDLDVARLIRALELGQRPYRSRLGRWFMPAGVMASGLNHRLSAVVGEAVRTGLVRHWIDREGDHLIPAPVHLRNLEHSELSACLFIGEDLGPMRSRLVDRLDLVDCLACERAVATGDARRL